MPIAPQTTIDPLAAFMAGAFVAGTANPCPLVATRFDVALDAGLAVVAMARTFRNGEAASIEATITFPVPVHAVLFALEVKIGSRVLKARAKRKDAAREHYEEALGRGKTAVLHEEVLRGVHMLSVGHIAPRAEVEVRATWAMTLTNVEGRGRLRIPLTVGDVYGRSGLADSDDLIHGGPQQTGTLTIDCHDGIATLIGGSLQDRQAEVALNAPIDIEVVGWSPRELKGAAADGSAVALTIAPSAAGEAALDIAMIVDHSGSMEERCSPLQRSGITKHEAVRGAIKGVARQLRRSDAVDLWEFNTEFRHVGSSREATLYELANHLHGPSGGTEIGQALHGALAGSQARDLLLVTDGKSHALDVQGLARSGRRFSVLLVGADSLEARVGHLAALSGGEIFVAAGVDLAAMLDAAVRSLRSPHAPAQLGSEMREHRAGMALTARWLAGTKADESVMARAIAALATSMRLPALSEEEAAKLAEAEGLVTHLTSLVLVDEDAATQVGIPATRKVALPTPATALAACAPPPAARPVASAPRAFYSLAEDDAGPRRLGSAAKVSAREDAEERLEAEARARGAFEPEPRQQSKRSRFWPDWFGGAGDASSDFDLGALGARIDWGLAPQRLQGGDLSTVQPELARFIRDLAREAFIVQAAEKIGCDPLVLVIALLARAASRRNRAARRLAQAILANRRTEEIESRLARHLRGAAVVSP
jgi:hypothetical protein